MIRHIKRLTLLFLITISMMLFAACTKDKELNNHSADSLPELVIGSDDYEPYNYIDENGDYAGVDVELAEEACRRMGYKPVFKQIVWENKDDYLASGEVDCLWGSFTMTGRENMYRWVGPYLYSRQVVVVKSSSDIYSLSDLAGARVAVQATSKPESILLAGEDSRIPEVRAVYSFSNMDELYASLRKGYADAIAGHESALDAFVETSPETYRELDESLYVSGLGVAFSKDDNRELIDELERALRDMQEDGTTRQIIEKYGISSDTSLEAADD